MTEEEFLMKLYGEAYKTAKAKLQIIKELGSAAYDKNGNLLPELRFDFKEKSVLSRLFNNMEEDRSRHL